MTVLSAIQNAAASIALDRPETVFSSAEREHFELQVLANTAALHIAKDYEWQALKAIGLSLALVVALLVLSSAIAAGVSIAVDSFT